MSSTKPKLVVPIGHPKGTNINAVAFTPDSQFVLTGGVDMSIKLWDLQGRLLKTIRDESGEDGYLSLTFLNEQEIVSIYYDKKIKPKKWNLWTETWEEYEMPPSNPDEVSAISPDGTIKLIGTDNGLVLPKDPKTGQAKGQGLKGHQKRIIAIQFSNTGDNFATLSEDALIRWKTNDYTPIGKPLSLNLPFYYGIISPDLSIMAIWSWGNTLDLHSTKDNQHLATCKGKARAIHCFSIDTKQGKIAFITGKELKLWTLNTNQPLFVQKNDHDFDLLHFIPNSDELGTVSNGVLSFWNADNLEKIWKDPQKKAIQKSIPLKGQTVYSLDFTPNGKKAIVGLHNNPTKEKELANIWELETGHHLQGLPSGTCADSVQFSPNGDKVLTGLRNRTAVVWDVASGQKEQGPFSIEGDYNATTKAVWSPDATHIAVAGYRVKAFIWDLSSKEKLELTPPNSIKGTDDRISVLAFTPDGTKVVAGYYFSRNFVIWDASTGKVLQELKDHFAGLEVFQGHISFSEDGSILFTGIGENSILIWDIHTGKKLGAINFLNEVDWVVTTTTGLFDATEGAMQEMYYVSGREIISLDQLKDRYYEPGLLNKIFEQGFQNLRDVNELNKVDLYPEVEATINVDQLKIKLTERSGGLGKVELYINGKTVWEDRNETKGTSYSIDLKNYNKYFSTREENRIAVRVYNEDGWLVSPEIIAERIDDAGAKEAGRGGGLSKKKKRKRSKKIQHKLYALFIGTGTYRGSGMNLKYPEKDATAMAKAIEGVGQNLFGAANLDIRLLTTKAKDKTKKPSRANIKKVLDDFAAKAKADDVCFIYLSGHGDNWGSGKKAQFYYLTYEMISSDISDSGIRASQTISSSEIAAWTNKIACKLQVLVLDACHSGKVVDSLLAGKKAVDSARIKALDRMKDRTGMFVLAGSPGDKVSYETSHFGQGLLTYSLLFGMKGASHVIEGADKFIDVMKLLQYSRDRVPQLAKEIDKVQQPILATPKGGDSFDIGIYDKNVHINLASRRPIIIQSLLINKTSYYDDLDISVALDQRLLQENAYANTARLTFVNIPRFKNAYTVRGVYEEKGTNVEVDIKIYQEGKEKQKFKLSKAKTDIKNLVEDIVDKLALLPV